MATAWDEPLSEAMLELIKDIRTEDLVKKLNQATR